MATVFLLQNQHKELLNKQGDWTDGREAKSLYSTIHRDEALNQMIEVNSKDYTLRIKLLECERNEKGIPLVQDDDLPPLGGYQPEPVEETIVDVAADTESVTETMVAVPDVDGVIEEATAEEPVAEEDDAAVQTKIEAMLAAQAALLQEKESA